VTEIDLKDFTWLTRKEAAEHLRVHVRTVDKWADEGRITRYKVEGIQSVRFKREELDALMVPEVTVESTCNCLGGTNPELHLPGAPGCVLEE
jgi:excisionase family DNA binding protein